jgi:hypothetical protein
VVLATANHFLADAAAGLAVTALGLLAARARTRPDATEPEPGGAGPAAALPVRGPGAGHPPPAAGFPVAAAGPAVGVAGYRGRHRADRTACPHPGPLAGRASQAVTGSW